MGRFTHAHTGPSEHLTVCLFCLFCCFVVLFVLLFCCFVVLLFCCFVCFVCFVCLVCCCAVCLLFVVCVPAPCPPLPILHGRLAKSHFAPSRDRTTAGLQGHCSCTTSRGGKRSSTSARGLRTRAHTQTQTWSSCSLATSGACPLCAHASERGGERERQTHTHTDTHAHTHSLFVLLCVCVCFFVFCAATCLTTSGR